MLSRFDMCFMDGRRQAEKPDIPRVSVRAGTPMVNVSWDDEQSHVT